MKEIRIHGRGGQGAVTTSEIIVYAAVKNSSFAACFPYFGFEKKGGPVSAFVRINDQKIREKNQVYEPDCIMAFDPTLVDSVDIFKGAKPGAVLVINAKSLEGIDIPECVTKVAYIDANQASMEMFGRLLPNTIVLGAFVRATGWVDLPHTAERVKEIWGEKNVAALQFGYENCIIKERIGGVLK